MCTTASPENAISNEVKPLPLLDAAAGLLGMTNEKGNLEVEVRAQAPTQPGWAGDVLAGRSPGELVGAWLE